MKLRSFPTASAAGLLCAQALAAPPAAAPASPWSKIPALPTVCYSSQDNWSEQNYAALHEVQQDHSRQDEINGEVERSATEALGSDPFAIAQRMQQAMLDDPQKAQQLMQQMWQQSEQAPAQAKVQTEKERKIEAEGKALVKQYQAALNKAMGAGNARLAALGKRLGTQDTTGSVDFLWLRVGDPSDPAWVWPERHAILKLWDEAYVATCAQWWTATGPFHAYMKRYKDYLLQERIPYEKQAYDQSKLQNFLQLNVPAKGWRTTTDYEAAEDYMNRASSLFGERETEPGCRATDGCR